MNRQVRRIEEKKERKQEREKEKAKAERRARRRERAEARRRSSERPKGGGEAKGAGEEAPAERRRGGRDPGRFSGALTIASLFFISLQAVTPMAGDVVPQLVAATYYLLFGYFATMWALRRRAERPLALVIGVGAALGVVTGLVQWLQPDLQPAPLLLALFAPLLVGGAFLGRVVFRNAPG